MTFSTKAYGAPSSTEPLESMTINRRNVGPEDVHINILYCGVCHSDLHQVRDEWAGSRFPLVPGHEIIGTVINTGTNVKDLKIGEIVGVGCMVNSCRNCDYCQSNNEQLCNKVIWTYCSIDFDETPTQGGYSKDVVVNKHFVCVIPKGLRKRLDATAPLLCAGITTYEAMVANNAHLPGKKVGVIGLGGLGHMAIKFSVAWGNEVTVISTSENKRNEAMKNLGAKHFVVTTNPKEIESIKGSLDFIIDTVSAEKNMLLNLSLLKSGGRLTTVGLPRHDCIISIPPKVLVSRSIGLSGSVVGGIQRTKEMLDFCEKHQIYADIENIEIKDINNAFERMLKSDVKYRFVIDIANSNF